MFFCPPYATEPCGLFSVGHLVLFSVTLILIAVGLWLSRTLQERQLRTAIRAVTALLWAMEVAKMLFVLLVLKSRSPNDFLPLYYCSLSLYAGLLSSVGRGVWQQIGDVFIATAGIVGGACFLVFPTTSLPRYPAVHFLSFHSFLLHGLMVYLGLLLLMRTYVPRMKDLKYCAGLISVMCWIAFAFNLIWNSTHPLGPAANLMFVSRDFPGTPVSIVYQLTGPLFPLCMWLIQALLPFLGVLGIYRLAVCLRRKRADRTDKI